ncbi:MAG: glycosyltransferase [Pleurocapsa sp.]
MKKVLIVGRTLELGRTEEVYRRGFENIGCQVQNFNWNEAEPSLLSRSLLQRVSWRLAWQLKAKTANQKLVETVKQFQPDLTFVISPLLMQPNTIKALKQYGLAFVFFTDNPLDNHHTHTNTWVQRGLYLWDGIFIWSQQLVQQISNLGISNVFYHPFCSDTQYHYPQRQNSTDYDVAFIGNWDDSNKREQYLKVISDYRLGVWGSSYWQTHCTETSINKSHQGMCSYVEIPQILGSAKIGLNILRPQNEMGHNIRTFEIPASGTLMLSERNQELLNLFQEDIEAVYFSSPEELNQKVTYLLNNQNLIETITEAGYQKALQHTIDCRIKEIKNVGYNLRPQLTEV